MTTTSSIPMTVDGTRLDTFAWNIETLEGRLTTPSVRGGNPSVPGRHGGLWVPQKTYDENTIVLKMWVIGSDVNGGIPTTEMTEFRKNIDSLTLLFGKRHGLLDVRQTWPTGVRQAFCEVLQSFDLSARAIQPQAKFSVALNIPAVFWQDVSTSDYASATALTSGTTLTLNTYDGMTAPIEDAIFVVRGPITNPRLTNPDTGEWVQLNAVVVTGQDWRIDCSTWDSRTGAGIGFTGASTTNQLLNTQYSGGGAPFMRLMPKIGGPQLVLSGSGTGGATQVMARGRRKYFT